MDLSRLPGQQHQPRVVVVGGGFSGLAAAYELTLRGLRPVILEAEPDIGGLAATFELGGTRIERFYHHWFTNDRHVIELVSELGRESDVIYRRTRTGMYFANKIYRLSTPLDVLRFPALSIADRIRLALTIVRARRVRNWKAIDHLSAAEWLRALGGDKVFQVVWEPLLRGKFGAHAEEVSAAWFWSKLRLRGGSRGSRGEEQLGYFRGGFAALIDELAERVVRAGGEVRRNTPARGLCMDGGRVIAVETDAGSVPADAVILTPALPIIADILRPHVTADYAERIGAIGYLANVCVVLELTRSLSELYWMNVNDPNFPFVGVIEHTNLDQADASGRRRFVYFSRYLPASDPIFGALSDHVVQMTLPHVKRMFPDFDPGCIVAASVWQARYAQPVVVRNYRQLVPPHRTPLPGVFIASMAQVYPEDRGTNYAIRDGRKVARMVEEFLGSKALNA
jgi:protoporphyrinogen oxidase